MEVHIGKEIEKIYLLSGMKLSEFAKRVNTSSRNIYSIFTRKEIKTDQLQKISEVLKFNFFSLYQTDINPSVMEDPSISYQKKPDSITVSLKLDGMQSTLERHIKKIAAINELLKQQ